MARDDSWEGFKGKRVVRVDFDAERTVLHLNDGNRVSLRLEGDCCSSSYFTDAAQFQELVGALIGYVEERGERDGMTPETYPGDDGETKWSFLVFVTDRGHITIDWRNDSNGYYFGSLFVEFE